jgi:NagD protein
MPNDLSPVRHIVLDMDGTIYLGRQVFPETLPFLSALAAAGISVSFITNNCSRSRAQYVQHLRELGVHAEPGELLTSAHATIHHLTSELPAAKRLFVLGTPGLCDDLRLAGFSMDDAEPDAVVVGFDTAMTYDRLSETAYWISRGLPFIATHPDRICPTDRATVLPDCGAFCALLHSATGRWPDAVPGKPNPAMLHTVCAQHQLEPHQIALVGDRLYTDIRMARDAGAVAVLTLTGETKHADLNDCPPENRPDVVVANLADLQQRLVASRT